jgi:chromosome segregation ATPase
VDSIAFFFSKFPGWAGSVPMWGVFAMILITLIKIWPQLRQQGIDERLNIRDRYLERIKDLVADVQHCRDECDAQERRLQAEIDILKDKLNNEAWQRVQGEISLVNTLIQIVDAPQLKAILAALEKRQRTLPPRIVKGDSHEGA